MQNIIEDKARKIKPEDASTKHHVKGQAAIEFLVTYGWAILAAMIVVGALAYFGIFNTQRYVNDVCYFGDQIICEDYVAYQNGTSAVKLRNNFGVPIDVTSAITKSDYGTTTCTSMPSSNIQSGTAFEVRCALTNGTSTLSLNNKLKYRTIVTFRNTGSTNLHNQTGDVILTVQKS